MASPVSTSRSSRSPALGAIALACLAASTTGLRPTQDEGAQVRGRVVDGSGAGVRGAFVTARSETGGPSVTVFSGSDGGFVLPEPRRGSYRVEAHGRGLEPEGAATPRVAGSENQPLTLRVRRVDAPRAAPSSSRLALLPDGETKRRFVLDCTGCHQLSERFAAREGRPRSRAEWEQAVDQMLSFAGPQSGFPIIAPGREPAPTAAWLVEHLGDADDPLPPLQAPGEPTDAALTAVITSYAMPDGELPHDLLLDPAGGVVITGMFRGVMYRLDPASETIEEIALPVAQGGPRALEIEADGTWWVLLGGPQQLARRDPSGAWTQHDIATYPHSVARDAKERVWYNAHFAKDPAWLASLDGASGEIRRYEVPPASEPPPGSPIPYEIRAAPDGAIWGSELIGNRVYRLDPGTGEFRIWDMPTAHSGPRRLDVAADGTVWIPEYANNRLARLDPTTGEIREFELPTPDALPYVARVDRGTGRVWVSEAGADAMAVFDPRTERFVEIPLPVSPGLVRHFDIDSATGVVWAATSQAPPASPTVLRIELPAESAPRR